MSIDAFGDRNRICTCEPIESYNKKSFDFI